VLFHPGTTDTALSKPFQKNVPADKLFSAEFVAKQLFTLGRALTQLAGGSKETAKPGRK